MRFKKTLACLMAGAMIGGGAGALVPGNLYLANAEEAEVPVKEYTLDSWWDNDAKTNKKLSEFNEFAAWYGTGIGGWVNGNATKGYDISKAWIEYDVDVLNEITEPSFTVFKVPTNDWQGELFSLAGTSGTTNYKGKISISEYGLTSTYVDNEWYSVTIQAGHFGIKVNSLKLVVPLADTDYAVVDGNTIKMSDSTWWTEGWITKAQLYGNLDPDQVELTGIEFTGCSDFETNGKAGFKLGYNGFAPEATTSTWTETDFAKSVSISNMDVKDGTDGGACKVVINAADFTEYSVSWTVTGTQVHSYGDVDYSWSDDLSSCTATITCSNEKCGHVVTETVKTTSNTTAATCTEKGVTVYTATFTNTAFFTQQTENVDIDATDHAYGEPEYEWSNDNSTCTATVKCANDESHVITETVNSTSNETAKATCTTKGSVTYSAVFTDTHFTAQSKEVDIDPLGVLNTETGNYEHRWRVENGVKGACEICQQEYCDHKGMETEVRDAKTASCTEKGYTGDIYCKNCGSKIGTGSEIALADHSWSEWTVTTAPQVGVKGVETRICSVCKTEETKDVDAVVYESDDIVNSVVTWKEDDDKDLTLTFHRSADDENAIEYYKGITIGGEAVEADAVKGSVKITISKDILSKLEDGEHDAVAEFTDGKIEFKVNVVRKKAADTAGTFPVGALAVLMVGAACAAGLSLKRRKAC